MSSTITKFKGKWFNANDALLGIWAHFMADEVDREPEVGDWLKELRDHWRLMAEIGSTVRLHLDEAISDESTWTTILRLLDRVDRRLEAFDDEIPVGELERTKMAGTSWGRTGLETWRVKKVSRTIRKLLNGDMTLEDGAYPIEKW